MRASFPINKPWLFLPTEWAHALANGFLSAYSLAHSFSNVHIPQWRSVKWRNLYFPNPLAPAGGLDKQAKYMQAWWALGAGFVEIGTITPKPQKKLLGPSLKKNNLEKSLWNHLGFPNPGVQAIAKKLKLKNKLTPVLANISNNRDTSNQNASQDFIQCIQTLHPYVDAFVINISSPNTTELCRLTRPQYLKTLLNPIRQTLISLKQVPKPFFIKWSPDLTEKDFLNSLNISLECGASGHILCNSTSKRNSNSTFPSVGAVSGKPLAKIAEQKLKLIQKYLEPDRKNQLLISVGGILSPKDALDRLNMGADLIQIYSALVFQGISFFKQVQNIAT